MPLPAHLDRIPHTRAIDAGALLATTLLASIVIMLTVTLGAAPKVAAQEPVTDEIQTLVSNVDARDVDDDTINVNLNGTAQVFRTGPQLGIRLHSIDVKFGTSVDKKYIVLNAGLHAVNDDGSRGARLTGFSYGDKKNNTMNRFWAREQIELEPSTAYMFVVQCSHGCANNNFLNIRTVSDNAEDDGSSDGWSIDDGRILPSDNWTPKPRSQSLKISVQGTSGHPRVVEDGFEIISSPVIGDVYANRELIQVAVTFTDPVTVNDDAGTPTLKFGLGDPDNPARTERMRYASGSGTDTLVFEYRVLPDDQDANGIYIHANSLQLNGGTINRTGYDLAALLRHPIPTGYGRAKIDSSIERPLAELTNLEFTNQDLSDIVLRPDFSSDLINYAATVHGGVTATTVTATRDVDTNVTITPADSSVFQPGHQVALEEGDNFIEILVTKPGHIDVPYTVEIRREPLVIPRITGVRVISRPLNQNTNVYGNDEPVEFEFTFDHPVVVDFALDRPTLAVDIWLNDSPQGPTDFPYARGSGTNALVFQLLNDEAGLLETAVGFGLSANSINAPEGSITHATGGGNANLNHRALHRIPNQYLDDRRNSRLATLDQVHLTNVTLDQLFRSRETVYTATPDHEITATTLTVTPKDGVSHTIMPEDADDVADGHQVELPVGTTEIVITATKERAATMTYTIAVVAPITPRIEAIEVISQPTDGETYVIGDTIEIAVTFDLPVLVDTDNGTPTIRVQFGSDEQPVDYSETTDDSRTIIFSHTVDQSLSDNDGISIPENPLNANGGIITYLRSGTRAALRHSGLPDQTQHRVNPDAMIVENGVQITSSPAADDTYGPAETITFTVEFDTPVTVKTSEGTPYLQFTMGNDARRAGYTSIGPDNRILTFAYTVAVGDEDDDGISMTANALILDGGAITGNVSANDADLEHPAPGTGGLFSGHKVDATTTAPVITGVALTSDAGTDRTYAAGDTITVAATYNQAVEIDTTDGTPSLAVTIGDDARAATYAAINSAKTVLTFSYTVVSEDSDQDGVSIAANSLTLNGGSITAEDDGADAFLIHAALPTQAGHLVNKIPLIVTDGVQITSTPASGDTYQLGETITFTATFDSEVNVDTSEGTPHLAITLGNANRQAPYTAIDATKRILTFSYTVVDGDLDEDGLSMTANALALNGGTIKHTTTGKDADLSHGLPGTSGSFPNHRADGSPVPPAIATDGVTITSTAFADGDTYGRDDIIVISVTFTTPVVVDTTDGTPTLSVRIGDAGLQSRNRKAEYQRGTGSSTLQFEWRVRANDRDNNGIQILADSLELNGGTIQHATNGTDALLTHPLPGGNGIFADHKVDGRLLPALASLSSLSFSGATLSPTFEPTTISYTAKLPADAASTTVTATAETGTTITIEPADSDSETDGHQVDLTEAPDEITVTASRADSTDRVYRVNIALVSATIIAPAIADGGVTITSMPLAAADTYGRNEIIVISVAFTSPVVVNTADGTPTMTFKVGNAGFRAGSRRAEYQRGSGSSTLQFEWRVLQGNRDNNGIRIRANALQLNGGTIQDATTSIDALLTHPDPVAEITFGNHKLNGRLLADFTNLSDLSLSGGTLAPNFDSTVLRYSATFPADSTSTTVTATAPSDHTVSIQPADSDTEATGHQVDLTQEPEEVVVMVTTASAATYTYRVKIVVSSPEITALAFTSDPGSDSTYATGDVITATATYNVPVTVDTTDGTPSLALTIGDNARDAGYTEIDPLGRKITFSYTVISDDSDQDGISIAANSLTLNSGAITAEHDGADASLDHAALATQTGHLVNKIPLIITGGVQITSSPASGDTYELGETITFTVTFDSDVDVDTTYGTPYLATTLGNANRQAAYTAIDTTKRILTFSYTVVSDDMDEDGLSVPANAIALNGGTIKHTTTGKDADLSHGLPGMSGNFPSHRADGVPEAPTITGLTLTSDAGSDNTYATGDAITVAVTYSEAVGVDTTDGTPGVTLAIGDNTRNAGYTSLDSSKTVLTFSYTVVADDSDQDGVSIAADPWC